MAALMSVSFVHPCSESQIVVPSNIKGGSAPRTFSLYLPIYCGCPTQVQGFRDDDLAHRAV
jgi:hypothetical protein